MAASEPARVSRPTLVTGATGVLGSAVLAELAARGMPARGLSRTAKPSGVLAEWSSSNMLTGDGLAEALVGVGSIVHCVSDPRHPKDDLLVLDRLIASAKAAGSPHLIFVSIAGIERAARHYLYYRTKLEAEQRLCATYRASTVVRSTQFHPFVAFVLRRLDLKVTVIAPRKVALQPVSTAFVASQLVDAVITGHIAHTIEINGPEVITFSDLARTWLVSRRRETPVIALPIPIQPLKAMAALDLVKGVSGGTSWKSWLSDHANDAYEGR